jgi:predicted flap endonuclease-1-like 5' DNA nuclease
MSILRKLKSLLGADDAEEEADRDVTVTVEHDPENEAAVKGAEVEEPGEDTEAEADVDGESIGESIDEEPVDDEPADDDSADVDAADVDAADVDAAEPVEIPDAEGGTADAEAESQTDGDEAATDDATDAEATDDAGDAEASGSDESVDVLNGIGPAYAERLENAGIETVGELAAADAATLAEDADIAEGRIQGWIDQATEY